MTQDNLTAKAKIIGEIRTTIAELRDLPTLPAVAHQARKIINDPKSSMKDLVEIIKSDLAISGRILRIANSAYYGIPRKVDNLRLALVILGMSEIANLVTTISVLRMFKGKSFPRNFDILKFWGHGAFCAEISVELYKLLKLPIPNGAYIAGLLHDVGKLVMALYFEDLFNKCQSIYEKSELRYHEIEVREIGIDHGHIGSWLVKRWNLPDNITQSIARHHIRPSDAPQFDLSVIVDWADRFYYLARDNDPDQIIEFLNKSEEWKLWHGGRIASNSELQVALIDGAKRSGELITALN